VAAPSIERIPEITADKPAIEERLKQIWKGESGLKGYLSTVDHKELGRMYIVTAFTFLLMGGVEALVMRLQLAGPNNHLLAPEQYDQIFSMHGITMIFLYAFPVLTGFSVYLWPLILGTRDLAFPRLNSLSYWVYPASGIFIYMGFFLGMGANDGWFNYVPYANRAYNPGMNMDFYALGMIFLGISTTLSSANFIVTYFRLRAPGMSVNRVPIMTWGTLSASFANILTVPSVSLAFLLLWLDRQFNTHFYDVSQGGQPLLWQHLFWIFAHPWVYALVLPAQGMVSEGLPVFCRRPLVGYTAVAIATVATMMLGFGVWVHHMFATGLPRLSLSLFSGVSIIIAIPSAVQVFAWIATIWTGRPRLTTAFLFYAAFIVLFVIGGVSGFMTASVPADWQLTDTYWIVAHIHYVLIGINLFAVVGSIYYWYPKITGRMLSERLGYWNFWTMFIGFNVAFLPMHWTGLWGMPRRIYTYMPGMGWAGLNMTTTIGAFILATGVAFLLINIVVSYSSGEVAGSNPWDAGTLEWSVFSPPPVYDFAVIPQVFFHQPLWTERLHVDSTPSVISEGPALAEGKEVLATTPIEAIPDLIVKMPEDSYAPFLMTLAISGGFVGLLLHWWWLAALGAFGVLLSAVYWLWPESELAQRAEPQHGV
jgi:cytochrome c oxidase subunit I+III